LDRIRKRRLWIAWTGVILAGAVVLCGLAGIILCEAFLRRPRQSVPAIPGARTVQINARDAIALRAWLLKPDQPNGDAVLVLHGSATNRASQLALAQMLLAHGYLVLAPDNRGHGESGGTLATYGLYEADDVHRWVSWLIADQRPRALFGIGESMGGAVLIESLGVEHRFNAIVSECAFSSFERIARDRIAERLPIWFQIGRLLAAPPVWAGILYARLRYGLELRAASPEAAIARSTRPILLIHGLKDPQTPPEHARILARQNPRYATLWLVPGAGHTGAFSTAPREFQEKVLEFFAAHWNFPHAIASGPGH
jgi:hypothetical protein